MLRDQSTQERPMEVSILAAAVAATLLAGTPAQTTTPDTASAPPATQSQAADASTQGAGSAKGIALAESAPVAVRFVSSNPADLMASRLVGMPVYNNQNEKLGEVEDLSIKNGKRLSGVVVSVGGFLGMGERYVLIDPSTLVVAKEGNDWKAFIGASRDDLKSAPQFDYSKAMPS
jgi:sporulation protein YlmC with PRC-barrel domain